MNSNISQSGSCLGEAKTTRTTRGLTNLSVSVNELIYSAYLIIPVRDRFGCLLININGVNIYQGDVQAVAVSAKEKGGTFLSASTAEMGFYTSVSRMPKKEGTKRDHAQ